MGAGGEGGGRGEGDRGGHTEGDGGEGRDRWGADSCCSILALEVAVVVSVGRDGRE